MLSDKLRKDNKKGLGIGGNPLKLCLPFLREIVPVYKMEEAFCAILYVVVGVFLIEFSEIYIYRLKFQNRIFKD